MRYKSLSELIRRSASSRSYLLSLPVEIQMQLHEQNAHIRTLYELRRNAEYIMRQSFEYRP